MTSCFRDCDLILAMSIAGRVVTDCMRGSFDAPSTID